MPYSQHRLAHARNVFPKRKEGEAADREPRLEDARSIRDAMWRIARYAQDAAETLEARIEAETLDGRAEAAELREGLERVQTISHEVSEELDAYQNKHGG